MKKRVLWYLLDSIFLIVFNMYFFLLKGSDHPASVWISYGFIHFTYLGLLLTPYLVRKGSAAADYGRPLFVITYLCFYSSYLVGVIFIIIAPESYTIPLLVHVTITAVFAIALLANIIANEDTADNVEKHELELIYVKESSSKLKAIMKQIADTKVSKKIEKAYDLIHSSPLKSSNTVKSVEREVMSEIDNLKDAVASNDIELANKITDKIYSLADERNRQLSLLN